MIHQVQKNIAKVLIIFIEKECNKYDFTNNFYYIYLLSIHN